MALASTAGGRAPRAVTFDVFGTLIDPGGAVDALRAHVPEAHKVAQSWRRHQLEISWLLSLIERYEDFDRVTVYALDTALAETGVALSAAAREEILDALARLPAYDDVAAALERLESEGFALAVLSNGSPRMLESTLAAAGIRGWFQQVISVDEVRVYKPSPTVYRHAAKRLGVAPGEVWLVSGNPFDCAGAKAAGLGVAKLERGASFAYAFAEPADLTLSSLEELADSLGTSRLQ